MDKTDAQSEALGEALQALANMAYASDVLGYRLFLWHKAVAELPCQGGEAASLFDAFVNPPGELPGPIIQILTATEAARELLSTFGVEATYALEN
jgi:hypothetical protein